jgi:hypothetical protein
VRRGTASQRQGQLRWRGPGSQLGPRRETTELPEDPLRDGRGDDGSQQAPATAAGALEDVEVEGVAEEGGPVDAGPGRWPGRGLLREGELRARWRRRGRRLARAGETDDDRAETGVGPEDAMEADEVPARRRQEGGEALHQLGGGEDEGRGTRVRGPAEAVGVAAVIETGETLLGEGPAGTVAAEALEAVPVGLGDEGVGVEREAVDDGEATVVLPRLHGGEGLGGSGEGERLLEGLGAELLDVAVGGSVGVEEAPDVELSGDATGEGGGDAGDVGGRGRRQGDEADGAVVDFGEEAVRAEDVEVRRQLEGAAEVLGEGDGARVETAGDAEAAGEATLEAPDALEEGLQDEVEEGRVLEGEPAEAEGEGEGPLAVGGLREDVVDEVLRGEGRFPAVAGGAVAAALAREADEELLAAGLAADAGEAMAEDAAAQGGAHLTEERLGQRGAGGRQLGEALAGRPLQR